MGSKLSILTDGAQVRLDKSTATLAEKSSSAISIAKGAD